MIALSQNECVVCSCGFKNESKRKCYEAVFMQCSRALGPNLDLLF